MTKRERTPEIDAEEIIELFRPETVSYTHLTLPTT